MPLFLTVFLGAVMQLLQYGLQFCGDRQAEMRSILNQGDAFIGQLKEDDGGTKDANRTENLYVEQMANPNQSKD